MSAREESAPELNMTLEDLMPWVKREDIPLVFDVKYLAHILRVSESTAYSYIHIPGFPAFTLRGSKGYRIHGPRFIAWLDEQAAKGSA